MPSYDDIEVWEPIPGFGDYEVSDHGRVKSYAGRCEIRKILKDGRVLPISVSSHGYVISHLVKDKKKYFGYTHRLVLMAHVGPPPIDKPICHHKDGNKLNNHVSNLEWSNQSRNVQDGYDRGTHLPNGPERLKSDDEIRLIKRFIKAGIRNRDISDMFEIPSSYVSNIKTGRMWKYVGESI